MHYIPQHKDRPVTPQTELDALGLVYGGAPRASQELPDAPPHRVTAPEQGSRVLLWAVTAFVLGLVGLALVLPGGGSVNRAQPAYVMD